MTRNAVPANFEGSNHLSYGMAGDRFFGDSEVARYARVFDVTVLGRPGSDRGDPRMATAEAVLFESGRPVLLAPPEPPKTLGETIVIAWNRSMELARATAFAMPLLLQAKKVFVLTIEAHNVEGPPAEQLAQMLARTGNSSRGGASARQEARGRASLSRGRRVTRRRPHDQGRLYAEPIETNDFRGCDPSHLGLRHVTRIDGALSSIAKEADRISVCGCP